MSKILRRRIWSNGYGCQCCGQSWEETDWIDEEDMIPIEKMFGIIDRARKKMSDDHQLDEIYEKEGEWLYGYQGMPYRIGEDNFVFYRGHKWLYRTDAKSSADKRMTKAQILKAIEKIKAGEQ